MLPMCVVLGLVGLVLSASAFAADAPFCPFVIPAVADGQSQAAFPPGQAIAPDSPRLVARDGHFFAGDQRVRLWGINLTFANCFPTHADAEQLAQRLAQAGVNCVRFHHMDMHSWPQGIWDQSDPRRLSGEALNRLDYLLAQLAARGIYADINLHVSRTSSRILGLPTNTVESFDKMVDIFTPQLVEAQKNYARELLGHVNQYRGVRLVDDPATAIVEINNEDSLFMWDAMMHLRDIDPYYIDVLRGQFVAYLKSRYGATASLRQAWAVGAQPLGKNLLADADLATAGHADSPWILQQIQGAAGRIASLPDGGARIDITKSDDVDWHIQFQQHGLALRRGQLYTLRFQARSDKLRRIAYNVSQAHDPWNGLGLAATAMLTPQWATFTEGFVATQDEAQARLTFLLSKGSDAVEFRQVLLAAGGREGLASEESLEAGNVAPFPANPTEPRSYDTWRFLAQTEKTYYDAMRDFVKIDLNGKAMVTGTIVFGPLSMYAQSDMDFIDCHAYWQHPLFPGKPWDPANWRVKQLAMVDSPADSMNSTLAFLAAKRMSGKPYTITEYNHPAPNDYQAECIPLLASFAAGQDWDGIFPFDYGPVPSRDRIDGYFDLGSDPAKWGFMALGAAIFRNEAINALPGRHDVGLAKAAASPFSDELIGLQIKHDIHVMADVGDIAGLHWQDLLDSRLYVHLGQAPPATGPAANPGASATKIIWRTDAGHGVYQADGRGAMVWVGFAGPSSAGTSVQLSSPPFAAVMLAAMDGRPWPDSHKALLAACGRCENTDMIFSADRQSVGRNWGKAPVQIQPVDARIHLPAGMTGPWTITPLGPDGRPTGKPQPLPADSREIVIHSADQTMWYLLTRP